MRQSAYLVVKFNHRGGGGGGGIAMNSFFIA